MERGRSAAKRAMTAHELRDIYRRTVRELYGFVSRRAAGDRELAEDVVQETYLRALRTWRKSVPEEPIAWLKTVARNLLASHYRRVRPQPIERPEALPSSDDLGSAEVASAVRWALSRVGARRASLIEAFHFDEKPVSQIAREMGISERAVEGRLRRARTALRTHLRRLVPKRGA